MLNKNADMKIQLAGKRALVTGGSSGIGEAIALALAEAGAKVAINYLTHPESANENVGAIQQNGGEAIAVQADVSDANAVAEMFQRLDAAWGGIDILVNNTGIDGQRALSWEADFDAWRKVIEVNLFGAFHCAREALQRMVPQKSGVVLNISSVHEEIAWSGYSAYAASKAALGMLTKTAGPGSRSPWNTRPGHRAGRDQDADQSRGLERSGGTEGLAQKDSIEPDRRAGGNRPHGGPSGFRGRLLRDGPHVFRGWRHD